MNQYINPQFQNPAITQQYMNRVSPYVNQIQNNGINWVQGIEGAKAWQLPPNSNVVLMDSDTDGKFYIKVSDNVGMCTLRVFEYKEITEQKPQQVDLSQYVKKSELESLLNSLLGGTNESTISTTKSKTDVTK